MNGWNDHTSFSALPPTQGDYALIRIRELRVFAHHGVYEAEHEHGQNFYINLDAYLDISPAAEADELAKTVNYGDICRFAAAWMEDHTFKLIESVAERLSLALLLEFPLLEGVKLEIRKPEAPIGLPVESVSVERSLRWHRVYLSLGSNIGDREGYLEAAYRALDAKPHTQLLAKSGSYDTKPYGVTEQANFLNSVALVRTVLPPLALLDFTQGIELENGRERKEHWGPRTLDIDLLFYDDLILGEERLVLPHPDLANREFVLAPLAELAGNLRHPVTGKTVSELWGALK